MATTKKKSSRKKAPTNKPAAKKTSRKKSSKKKTTSRKKSSKKKTSRKKSSTASASKKTTSRKKSSKKKTTSRKKSSKKATTSSKKSSRTTRGASARPVSLGNAQECATLEECRGFIRELSAGTRQMNDWLNDLHAATLSAEQARDRYAEQVSDLVEALDQDQIKIAQLEAELKKARGARSKTCASEAVLAKLDELSGEIKTLRGDLKRVAQGRPMSASRRREADRKERATRKAGRKPKAEPGPLAKYDLISGAACSVGVAKYGYPPEVCAPAALPRSEAARVLGQYAQNNYSGLMEWATITGLPIRGGGPSVDEPKRTASPAKARASSKKKTSAKKRTTPPNAPATSTKAKTSSRSKPSKSNGQILNELLVTIQRI